MLTCVVTVSDIASGVLVIFTSTRASNTQQPARRPTPGPRGSAVEEMRGILRPVYTLRSRIRKSFLRRGAFRRSP